MEDKMNAGKIADKTAGPRAGWKTWLVVALIVVICGTVAGISARYIFLRESGNKVVNPTGFYFVTNVPENSAAAPYASAGDILFSVFNYGAGDSNVSANDIEFDVVVTLIDETSGGPSEETVIRSGSELAGGEKGQLPVSITGLTPGLYAVVVRAKAPFEKEICLYYRVTIGNLRGSYIVRDHGMWSEIDVYTGSDTSAITVKYDGFAPDNTDPRMRDWKTSEGATGRELTDLTPNARYTLIFFGQGTFTPTLQQSGTDLVNLRATGPAIGFGTTVVEYGE